MGSDSQQPSRILWPSGNRPPGIRRFSKESKVPNKRERKSFRVYVEVSRAQHPASKPELEADGFGQSNSHLESYGLQETGHQGYDAFRKKARFQTKEKERAFVSYVEVSRAQHPASKPELEADGFGQSTAISNPMAFRKQATRDTTLFERKQGSKQKRKKELSCLC